MTSLPGEKDLSAPFPCQNRPCGCRSAEQCWKQCCCFTHAQKLTWARQHQVTAPAYVVTAARAESKEALCQAPAAIRSGCCSTKIPVTCSDSDSSSGKAACCRTHDGEPEPAVDEGTNPAETENDGRHGVILALMQHCQGQHSLWNSLPWSVIPDTCLSGTAVIVPAELAVMSSPLPCETIRIRPPVPPPRTAC